MNSTTKGGPDMSRKRKPLSYDENLPCLNHHCFLCCKNTEMPLTKIDIERLKQTDYKPNDFTVKVDGEIRLRNVSGNCYFLLDGLCSAYDKRPEGCRLYPLVFDENTKNYLLDSFCPYRREFKVTRSNMDKLKMLLEELDKEDIA